VLNSVSKQRKLHYLKEYCQKNSEKVRRWHQTYRNKNLEKVREQNRKWYHAHKENLNKAKRQKNAARTEDEKNTQRQKKSGSITGRIVSGYANSSDCAMPVPKSANEFGLFGKSGGNEISNVFTRTKKQPGHVEKFYFMQKA